MARPRLSEQFAWDERKVKRLRCYVSAGTTKQVMAQLLRCSVAQVTAKMTELGIDRPKVRWDDRPRADRAVRP